MNQAVKKGLHMSEMMTSKRELLVLELIDQLNLSYDFGTAINLITRASAERDSTLLQQAILHLRRRKVAIDEFNIGKVVSNTDWYKIVDIDVIKSLKTTEIALIFDRDGLSDRIDVRRHPHRLKELQEAIFNANGVKFNGRRLDTSTWKGPLIAVQVNTITKAGIVTKVIGGYGTKLR